MENQALTEVANMGRFSDNVEDNSDFNTSNESYMSDEPEDSFDIYKTKELTREEKALVGRRFEPYFANQRMTSDDYFRKGQKPY